MALPKIDVPTYQTILPSSEMEGKKVIITYRPFLVKEEKLLLLALSSETPSPEDIARATIQVLQNCILAPENFDVTKMAFFDIEHLMTQMRINAQGEELTLKFSEIEGSECPECAKPRLVKINLQEAKVTAAEGHTNKLKITDTIGIVMKYPTLDEMFEYEKMQHKASSIESLFSFFWKCIDHIYDAEQVYATKDISEQEGIEWLESLNRESFSVFEQFFTSMPKLRQTVNIKCGLCGHEQNHLIEGYQSFFA